MKVRVLFAESGGGKLLDANNASINPFLHDRKKTFQPRDLWESLLRLAIVLFTIDVGVRRIQIDRDEWARAMQAIWRRVFFWQGVPRAPEAEESLTALLARRNRVRSTQTAPAVQPKPELFRPERPAAEPLPGAASGQAATPTTEPATPAGEPPKAAEEPAASTTSRLLEAKRRAQQRKK